MAGGKKIGILDALTMAHNAVQQGASGVDMGRNIFQSENPVAMIQAVKAIVHENASPDKAFKLFNDLTAKKTEKKSETKDRPSSYYYGRRGIDKN